MNRETLIQGLNEDLAAELGTATRYTCQHAAGRYGLRRVELREWLGS
jgi:hypothetical protein